jgi:putative FmdB family regulatory protein
MPIYGYRCRSCGHEFEVLQKMSDAPLKTCPKCSGQLSKIPYAAGIIYKGSGYYSTDYKGGGKAASKAAANGSSGDSGDSGAASSETKKAGESKPESKGPESSSTD